MSSKLYELDPSVIEGRTLPKSFLSTIYVADEVMEKIGCDDVSAFWLAVRAGRIPIAVWLPTDPPAPVWDRRIVDTWVAAGCPVPLQVVRHNYGVLSQLMDDVESELPARPHTQSERN